MSEENRSSVLLSALFVAVTVVASISCGGGDGGGPTAPAPPAPNPGFATFRLVGAGYNDTVSYSSGSNFVLCTRNAGFADLFIRFAEQAAGNGETSPHLDFDLCSLGDGGTFTPKDPQSPSCGAAQTFGVFWHDNADTFLNQANAGSCSFTVSRNGTTLTGTFSCSGLVELGGNRTLDVLDGSFQCTEQ